MRRHIQAAGIACEAWCVPGAPHFYPSSSTAVDAGGCSATLNDAVAGFLHRQLSAG